MDPHRDSPLDQWARKHLSVVSAASVDLLDPFPPPVPEKHMKSLPPIPDEFDFQAPNRAALVTPPPAPKRAPPLPFNFNSLNDHLRMAIYQIEAGTDQWAKVHIDHATARGSLIGFLLSAAGAKAGWWSAVRYSKADLDRISAVELAAMAGEPAPRLAGALRDLGFSQLAAALETAGSSDLDPPSAPSTPFARTHSRSNSSQSLNSSHMFPYPWRSHSRNSSQASLR